MSPTRSLSALAGCLIFALAALGASSASAEVNHATGNFYEVEVDYEHLSDPALTLTRTYNSKQALVSDLGPGWSMNYVTERLVVSRHPGTIVETYGPYTRVVQPTFTTEIYYQSKSYERTGRAVLQQPDGKTRNLTTDGSTWRMPGERQTQIDCVQPHSAQLNPGLGSAPAYGLVSVAHNVTACGAFVVRSADGTVKTYTQTGGAAGLVYLLTAVQLDGGWAATLTYNQAGQLASVTSSFGRALQFTYTAGKLTQLNGPGGYQVQYAYNPDGSLASATKPAGSGRQYTYQLGRYLTHIRDSAGGLRRQITYDASNRATRVERQGGVGAYTFAYNTDGSTTVTNPNGLAATYQFASIGGARRLMSVSNPGCGCPSTTSQYSYDDNGAIVSAGDFNGASTSYTRDEFGRELSRYDSEGQVTETAWAPILNRKTRVVQAGVETAFEYDTAGNVVTRTETSSAGIRTWTYTYNGPLLTAVSGPGTQYNETYTYNAQGDLTSIVNAKGHATQITSRDAQGRILSITASSGLIHQFTYDAAGRVLTQSSGGELTLFVYGSAGELLSVTRPDGHQVSFTHDGAKRVIGATDNRGASVTYTLDAMGNVTRQEVRDGGAALSLVVNQVFNSRGWMTATSGASGQTTQFGHDGVGRLRSATDPLNRTTSWTLDTIGRIQQIIHADSATATTYWHAGNVSSFYDPVGGTTEYQWNGFRELVGENSSDAGSQTLSRDASGLVSSVTDA